MKKINVAGAVILNDKGQVLCALRSSSMSMPNLWEFPGGKIEPGETAEESLVREIHEELGCIVTIADQIEDVEHLYPTVLVRLLTYKAYITEGEPTAKEHARIDWFSPNELNDLEWAPADLPTVRKLID
jgi:8-oxo-dGTP diphosphatase